MNYSVSVPEEGIGTMFKENRDGCWKSRRIQGEVGDVRCQRLECYRKV